MKQILLYTLIIFSLVSCQQEDSPLAVGKGYLSLASLEIGTGTVSSISTRAVSPGLAIEILKADGTPVIKYDAGAAEASGKIELEAGNYILKAYSPNHNTSYDNNEKGEPKYYKEQTFTIEPEKVSYLNVKVPMMNFGVSLVLPQDILDTWFNSYTFTITLGDRTLTLQNSETAYFDLPADDTLLAYSLEATNKDNESFRQDHTYNQVLNGGTVYVISYFLTIHSADKVRLSMDCLDNQILQLAAK